jgi:hypothetical protein
MVFRLCRLNQSVLNEVGQLRKEALLPHLIDQQQCWNWLEGRLVIGAGTLYSYRATSYISLRIYRAQQT